MEQKYHTTAEQLDNMRRKLESVWLRNQELENQMKAMSQGTPMNQLMRQPSKKFISIANGASVDLISDDEEEGTETESEEGMFYSLTTQDIMRSQVSEGDQCNKLQLVRMILGLA